jgi:FMN reductase
MTSAPLRVVVVTAGLSQPSSTRLLADRLAGATEQALTGHAVEIETIELRDRAHDLTNHLLTGFPGPDLAQVLQRVRDADALIAVTPIFNASYSGLFKTFFDVLGLDALVDKPVLIAATGGSARHSLALDHALRPLFAYLRAVVVPTAVYAATEDWAFDTELNARIQRAAGQLAQLVGASTSTVTTDAQQEDDAAEVIPFTQLLAAQRSAAVQQLR